jgi:UDP:flavonoid glycosyltransferase YjiC (YdhE family)
MGISEGRPLCAACRIRSDDTMKCDVAIIGDFRFPGGTSSSIAHEIRALSQGGYSVGLVPVRAPILKRDRPIHPLIQAAIDRGDARLVTGDAVEARLGLFENPQVFTELSATLPRLSLGEKVLVVHHPALDARGAPWYDPARVQGVCEAIGGDGLLWAPISPVCRANLRQANLPYPLLDDDWLNIFFVEDWRSDRARPAGERPVIGRHSRPEWHKWPATRGELLTIYPDDPAIDVRLLGVGDHTRRLVGDWPANWSALEFGAVDPAAFLRSIDFFVYFHHPEWVEAFGRTVAEAIASGAVAILPEHFRATFGEAALYRAPEEVVPTVRELYDDWEQYRLQSGLGTKLVERRFGPRPYLDRVARLIGGASDGRSKATRPCPSELIPTAKAEPFDVVVLTDMRTPRDTALRIAHETGIQAEAGLRTGFLHLPAPSTKTSFIHPEIDGCVREGLAEAIDPRSHQTLRARLLVIHAPHAVSKAALAGLPRIVAERILVVVDQPPQRLYDVAATDRAFAACFGGRVTWAAVNGRVRRGLEAANAGIDLWPQDWRPAVQAPARHRDACGRAPVVGRVSLGDASQWPASRSALFGAYPDDGSLTVRVLGSPTVDGLAKGDMPPSWECFKLGEIACGKFIDSLDFFVYFAGDKASEIPETPIAEAMARGVVPILSPNFATRFGDGALYCEAREAGDLVRRLAKRRQAWTAQSQRTIGFARDHFGPQAHLQRLRKLMDEPRRRSPRRQRSEPNRALFVTSNGVGLGHLTRLLAIARRLPEEVEPVFATMSQAFGVVEGFGYPVEYIPFHVYAECNPDDWQGWLHRQLDQMIEFYGARALVFDGSTPYSGLLRATAPRRDLSLIWVRRAFWQPEQRNDDIVARQRFFDLIIEPEDIAESCDTGATVAARGRAARVPPIRLLDPDELLPRAEAAAALGLDPKRPAVLVQLGGGATRNLGTLTDLILTACADVPDLQVVVAEWAISASPLDLWPNVKRLTGFPIARYFQAFDFAVSAAGYNTYHDVLCTGLPSIFVPDDHVMMDDQVARARFAENGGAAILPLPFTADSFKAALATMLDPQTRRRLRAGCRKFAVPNGAGAAARLIAERLCA